MRKHSPPGSCWTAESAWHSCDTGISGCSVRRISVGVQFGPLVRVLSYASLRPSHLFLAVCGRSSKRRPPNTQVEAYESQCSFHRHARAISALAAILWLRRKQCLSITFDERISLKYAAGIAFGTSCDRMQAKTAACKTLSCMRAKPAWQTIALWQHSKLFSTNYLTKGLASEHWLAFLQPSIAMSAVRAAHAARRRRRGLAKGKPIPIRAARPEWRAVALARQGETKRSQ